jgi:16S rRNA (guanine966-N2)-methyltransferase
MRIVAGTFRGRRLVAPKGHSTRPTADRTRQALFNILEHAPWAPEVEGARVLDLFAGSGALGLEAASRGAAYSLMVETSAEARAAIAENIATLGLAPAQVRIDRRDAALLPRRSIADGAPFDLVLLDPPYGEGLGEAALARLAQGGWLAPDAVAVLERGTRDDEETPGGFEEIDSRVWGVARVSFYRLA